MTSKDLIYRQQAIEALCSECQGQCIPCDSYPCRETEAINALPSAQPDLDEWCTDCKEYDSEKHCCPRFNKVIRQAMKDVQPERKKGKWIPHKEISREYMGTVLVNVTYDFWFCDICGYQVKNGQPTYNFCPNCGADMRQKEGGDDNRLNNT